MEDISLRVSKIYDMVNTAYPDIPNTGKCLLTLAECLLEVDDTLRRCDYREVNITNLDEMPQLHIHHDNCAN